MLIGLDVFVATMDTTPRRYFQSRIAKQDQIIKSITHDSAFVKAQVKVTTAPIQTTVFENDICTHPIRVDPNKAPTLIKDYDEVHLRSSVILHCLFGKYPTLKNKLDTTVFIWYYYHFINKKAAATIKDLTHQVCFELEEAIKIIIKKELTAYRAYNTTEIIACLRHRLASERLSNMGGTPINRGINFRR